MKHRTRRHRGNVLVLVTVSMVALVGVTGLVMDGGRMMSERRQAQNAADAAALAAATDLRNGKSKTQSKSTALTYASRNGYSNDGSTNTVTVNIPPASGASSSQSNAVEVITERTVDTYFIKLVYASAATVRARGVAQMQKNATLLLLAPSEAGALSMTGNASITVASGSVVVNSNHGSAITGNGNALITANPTDITGSYSSGCQFVGPVNTGVEPIPDPLASLPALDPTTLTVQANGDLSYSGGVNTIQPGRYKGKINLTGQAQLTMAPGIYYVDEDFSMSGQSILIANGVMIYVVGEFTATGQGSVTISPPTSGTYKNISIFQARNSPDCEIKLTGNGAMNISGSIYAPNSELTITGNGGVGAYGSQIIADTLTVTGNGTINLVGTGAVQGVFLSE